MQRRDADKLYIYTEGDICTYCGDPSQVRDHAYPIEAILRGHLPSNKKMLVVVPACWECNSLAMDYVFETLCAKRLFVQRKLRKKYRKILATPEWTPEEIKELCHNLKSIVVASLRVQKRVLERANWAPVKSVETNSSSVDSGNGSAQAAVVLSSTNEKQQWPALLGEISNRTFNAITLERLALLNYHFRMHEENERCASRPPTPSS